MIKINRALVLGALWLCFLFLATGVSAEWYNTTSEDIMTGEKSCYAISPSVSSVHRMTFPYSNTKGWIGVGYNGTREWVYFGFTNSPNLTNTSIRDGYSTFSTRIKWDDNVENARFTQRWGATSIHITDPGPSVAVDKLAKSNVVLLELMWHGDGRVHFEFPLTGSRKAIDKMYAECKG